uniref:MI domain-containing protein n=1 Tax=Ditylenchus dipsaci TaxID=166011 RepID=A0A915DSV4_9BILA
MDDRDFSYLLTRKCKRKEIRKTSKKVKKVSKIAFSKHQKVATAVQEQLSDKKGKKRAKRKRQAEKKQQKLLEQEDEPQELEAFLKEAEQVRRQRMREELDDDDAEIQRLEKKLNSRKDKNSQSVSAIDGDDQMPTEEFLDDEDGGFDFSDLCQASSNIEEGSGSEEDSVLGEAVDQQNGEQVMDAAQTPGVEVMNFDPALVNLASKANMCSETRRNVFCTIISSEKDTAFERLQKLRLDGPQEREIIRVCVECTLLESQHNQFYSMLVNKFCGSHARFQVTTQYVLWDLIKDLHSLKDHQQQNLAQMVADLFKFQAVGLSVLRIVDFSNLTQLASTFLKRTFYYFLSSSRDFVIRDAFLRVINSAGGGSSTSFQCRCAAVEQK